MTMHSNATSKIRDARLNWHTTIGEHVLRFGGIILALTIIAIGVKYGYHGTLFSRNNNAGYEIKYDVDRTVKKVLFVSLNNDQLSRNESVVLKEAIASYHGVEVLDQKEGYKDRDLTSNNVVVFVLGSQQVDDAVELDKLMQKVADRNIPLFWIGSGFSQVAHFFHIPFTSEEEPSLIPSESSLIYKNTHIAADGLLFVRGNLDELAGTGKVLASVKLYNAFTRAALIRHGNVIYSVFNPFSQRNAPFALSVIMDSLSILTGKHKRDPRVIFRLEDINGLNYNQSDSSFSKAANYLLQQGVYIHLAIIPTMVDAKGNVVAALKDAIPVLKFVRKNPEHVGIILHGYKHWRKDPRNKGMGSGDASEFFTDDDRTMGVTAAGEFAKQVIMLGSDVMQESNLVPDMFEAPHYVMSPAEQQAADKLFSLMQHPPPFYYDGGPDGFLLPWFTQRNTTVFTSSFSHYVEGANPDSVNKILDSLKKAAAVLPDPVVVVFFHPFILNKPGREHDLENLIQGIKGLNYRFVNMMDEVEPVSRRP